MAFGVSTSKVPNRLRKAAGDSLTVDLFKPETASRIPIDPHKPCPEPDYAGVRILEIVSHHLVLLLADESTVEVPIAQIAGIRTKNRQLATA